jgi:hypothetical protein
MTMQTKIAVFLLILLATAFPVLAQDGATHTVAFDGLRFSYDAALAGGVAISAQSGSAPDVFPPDPWRSEFLLYTARPVPESIWDSVGAVRVYPAADLMAYDATAGVLDQLQTLLANRPYLARFGASLAEEDAPVLPFLPVLPAGQVIRARAEYVDSPALSGIRYVTAYSQAPEPFTADAFIYTFLGLSADGRTVVSVIINLSAEGFPTEPEPIEDLAAFIDGLAGYLDESTARLNEAAPDSFSPSLALADALVASLAFES